MKKVTKTFIYLFLLTALIGVLNYIIRISFANNLTQSEYGLFYSVLTFILFLKPFATLGLGNALIYFVNKYVVKKDKKAIKQTIFLSFIFQITLTFVICIIIFLLKDFLVNNFFKDYKAEAILIYLLYF